MFGVSVDKDQETLPTFYWLHKLHKKHIRHMHDYRTVKIANPLSYYYQNHVIECCEKVYKLSGKNLFWSIKNSCEVLNKLKSRGFHASSLSTYDYSTLYTTLPHNLIKAKLVDLIWNFPKEIISLYCM